MAKTYELDGENLKEIETKSVEIKHDIQVLKSRYNSLDSTIDNLKAEKIEIKAILDEYDKLKPKK